MYIDLEFPKSKTERNHYLPLCDFLNNCMALATSLLINPQRNIMTIDDLKFIV